MNGRKPRHGCLVGNLPCGTGVETYLRIRSLGNNLGQVHISLGVASCPSGHVRLPRTDPDFAHQNILELNFVGLTRNSQFTRWTYLQGIQLDQPFAILAGSRLLGLITERHRDRFTHIGRPPDGNRLPALKHHAIAEHAVDGDGCIHPGRAKGTHKENR